MQVYFQKIAELFRSRTLKSISLVVSGGTVSSALGFITSVLVLRKVDPSSIGVIYPLLGIMMVFEQIGDLGISTSLVKNASHVWNSDTEKGLRYCNAVFRFKVLLAITSCAGGLILSKYIGYYVFHSYQYTDWVRITIGVSFFSILSTFFQSYLQIQHKFRELWILRVFPSVAKTIMLFSILYFAKDSFPLLYFAFQLIPLGTFFLGILLSNTGYLRSSSSTLPELKETLHVTKWLFASTIAVAFIGQADLFMLGYLKDANEIAHYVGGSRLASVFLLLSSAVTLVFLPKISAYKTKGELHLFVKNSLLLVPVLLVATVLVLFLAPTIIGVFLGSKYSDSIPVFRWFCAQFCLDLYFTPLSLVLYPLNKTHIFPVMNIFQLAILIASNFLLIPHFGAEGAAIGGLIIRVFSALLVLFIFYREDILRPARVVPGT